MRHLTKTVLHVSPDPELAGSRGRVLQAIGCEVFGVDGESAALFEISMGRCGILLLCHKLSVAVRESLADCFHRIPRTLYCGELAREGDHCPSRAHARVVFRAVHSALAAVLQQRLAA